MKDRKQARAQLPYQCQLTIAGDEQSKDGQLRDLSKTGCRISSDTELPSVGATLELCIYPEGAIPLIIDGVTVQWVKQGEIGVSFTNIRPDIQKRINEICRKLTW